MASAAATVLPPSLATAPSQAPPSALAQDPLLHPQGATFTPAPDVVSYDPSTTPQNPAHHVAPAPAGSKTSSLQVNVDKVKVQLEAKGGKHGAWLAGQIQGQADALKKIPVVGDINSGGKPIAFEVFKAGGVFSKDDVVKDESGQPQYYLSMPHTPLSSSWSLTLYRGGSPQSAPLATLLKSAHNPLTKDDIAITFVDPQYNGFKTVLTKTSVISKAHEWSNLRGERRKWKGEGMLSSGLMCLDMATGAVVATWEKSFVTYGKDGKLLVNPTYAAEMDLIVVTGLAMEEWVREEEEKSGKGGATSTKNLLGMGEKFLKK